MLGGLFLPNMLPLDDAWSYSKLNSTYKVTECINMEILLRNAWTLGEFYKCQIFLLLSPQNSCWLLRLLVVSIFAWVVFEGWNIQHGYVPLHFLGLIFGKYLHFSSTNCWLGPEIWQSIEVCLLVPTEKSSCIEGPFDMESVSVSIKGFLFGTFGWDLFSFQFWSSQQSHRYPKCIQMQQSTLGNWSF